MWIHRATWPLFIVLLFLGDVHKTDAAVGDDCSTTTCEGSNEVCGGGSPVCGCGAGYINSERTCVGECLVANIPEVTNGAHEENATLSAGDIVTYTCDAGYGFQDATKNTQTCVAGATYNGTVPVCDDYDECQEETHSCDDKATCINSIGSFTCTCNAGYKGNGTVCTGECPLANIPEVTNGGHDQMSVLSAGDNVTYTCDAGYRLQDVASNALTCVGGTTFNGTIPRCVELDECQEGTHGCDGNAICINSIGSFTCTCNAGYKGNGTTCTVECPLANIPAVTNGGHSQSALLSAGDNVTYTCDVGYSFQDSASNTQTCIAGTTFSGTLPVCVEFDECHQETPPCDGNATCINSIGSFTCTCNSGYKGNGITCTGECPFANIPAVTNGGHNQTSGLSAGDYVTYTCDDGYALQDNTTNTQTCVTGTTFHGPLPVCDDVNECILGHVCDNNATCINTIGLFMCTCHSGYRLDGTTIPTDGRSVGTMYVSLEITVDEAVNFTDTNTLNNYKDGLGHTIATLYNSRFNTCDTVQITIDGISKGSLVVNYTVIFPDNEPTHATIADINAHLANNGTLAVFDKQARVLALHADGYVVPIGPDALRTVVICKLFTVSMGGCPSSQECVIVDDRASCQFIAITENNICIAIGLTTGIPMFLLICLFIILIVIYKSKTRANKGNTNVQKRGKGNLFDPVVSTRYATSLRVSRPRVSRTPSIDSSADEADNWSYNDDPSQNFSWDFLTNHLNPYLQYDIRRPHVEATRI